jgi:hypothetical protein
MRKGIGGEIQRRLPLALSLNYLCLFADKNIRVFPTHKMRRGEPNMSVPLNSFEPELRELEKSTLNQMHAAIHQKNMRNSDRLLIFSHLIDRYIEMRTKIIMSVNENVEEQTPD